MEVATILIEDYYRPQPGTARATKKRTGNMPRLMINADAKPANPTSSDPAEMERIRRCRWLPPLSEAAKGQRGYRNAATLATKAGAAGDRLTPKAATGATAVKDHFPQSDIRKSQIVKKLCRVNPHTQFLEKLRQAHLVAARLRQKALEAVKAENTYNWAEIRRFSRDNEYARFFQNLENETGTTGDAFSDVANQEVQQRLVRTAESTTGSSCASAPPHGFGASEFALSVHKADGADGRFASADPPAAAVAAPATGVASRSTGMPLPAGSMAPPPAVNFAHGYAPLPQRYWAEFAQKKRRSLRPRKPNNIPWDGLHDAPGGWQQSAPEPDVEASEEYGRTYEEVMELKGLVKEKRHACEREFRKFDLETTVIKQDAASVEEGEQQIPRDAVPEDERPLSVTARINPAKKWHDEFSLTRKTQQMRARELLRQRCLSRTRVCEDNESLLMVLEAVECHLAKIGRRVGKPQKQAWHKDLWSEGNAVPTKDAAKNGRNGRTGSEGKAGSAIPPFGDGGGLSSPSNRAAPEVAAAAAAAAKGRRPTLVRQNDVAKRFAAWSVGEPDASWKSAAPGRPLPTRGLPGRSSERGRAPRRGS